VKRQREQVRISHPTPITEDYTKVGLEIDIMYVNSIPFLIMISRNILFGFAQALPDETYKCIYIALQKIIKIYTNYGFAITHILGDGRFETTDTSKIIHGVTLNIVTNNEHVPEDLCTSHSLSRSFHPYCSYKLYMIKLMKYSG